MRKSLTVVLSGAASPFFIVIVAVLLRLLPHPPNVAPIAAMALFGGAYLNKKYALVLPLAAMLVSDLFLGFHSTMAYVYGSFLVTGLAGLWLSRHRTIFNIIALTFTSSILFFLVTNFGVWASGGLYPKTFDGLMTSYVMGLPFFRNTLVGNFFYVGALFGGYEFLRAMSRRSVFRTVVST